MPEVDDVYRKLSQRLDAIPNGFPATESGVELRLLAKIFSPQEAALASVMRLTGAPAADIAARADMDPQTARRILKGMVRKGQIRVRRGKNQLLYGLMPFVVGIYEEQLPRMDAELAELFEQYLQETLGGGVVRDRPAVQRVIPVGEAIPHGLEVFPYERAAELLAKAKAWGVRDCICRVQQRLIGKGCDRPVESCLVFSPVEGTFDGSKVDRAITGEEALQILREAEEAGLVHTTGYYRDHHYYICNCCTCCCGVLRSVAEFGVPTTAVCSDFYAVVDADACTGCGDCVARCQFGALCVSNICEVDYARCVGCGLCTTVCPAEALNLERRAEGEVPPPPADIKDWMAQRARERGIRLEEIL
jgi:electron transport complex protein RnfB